MTSLKKSTLNLIVTLLLSSQNILAQKTVTNLNFNCLYREQKEKILVCFEENDQCHKRLEKGAGSLEANESNFWIVLIMTGALGLASGFVIRGATK